jgi:GNAT superfamily N-acetyltransferase
MNRLEVLIRPARLEDTPQVLEMVSHIWEGEDYVAEVWDEWLNDPYGCLLAAEYENRVVGIAKLSRSSPQDWWMQGLRVHPDFGGRGIASQLHEAILDFWSANCQGAVRLATSAKRLPVHHLCERTGFQKVGEYTYYQAGSLTGASLEFEPVTPDQASEAFAYTLGSPIISLTSRYIDLGWEWLPPRLEVLQDIIQHQKACWYKNRQGLLAYREDIEEDENGTIPTIMIVASPEEELKNLLLDYRHMAGQGGYQHAGYTAPVNPELQFVLESAGFERAWDGSVYLFEKTMRI